MNNNLMLTDAELIELTGFKRQGKQVRWLKDNKFKFRINAIGRPRVDRTHYMVMMSGEREKKIATQPNWPPTLQRIK
jgi:hypothetical protein